MLAQPAEKQKAGRQCVVGQFDCGGQGLCPTAPPAIQRIASEYPVIRPQSRIGPWQISGKHNSASSASCTGILFVLRGGLPWQMLPREMGCGSGSPCWRRLVAWQRAGVWQRLRAARSGTRGRPPRFSDRRRGFGRRGASRAQSASSSSGRAMPDRTKSAGPVQEGRHRF